MTSEVFVNNKTVSLKKEGFADVSSIVAVEISAACDYSNDKPRLHSYMLGILCTRKDYDDYVSKSKNPADSILVVPFDFLYDNDVYYLIFNKNYSFNEETTELFGKL